MKVYIVTRIEDSDELCSYYTTDKVFTDEKYAKKYKEIMDVVEEDMLYTIESVDLSEKQDIPQFVKLECAAQKNKDGSITMIDVSVRETNETEECCAIYEEDNKCYFGADIIANVDNIVKYGNSYKYAKKKIVEYVNNPRT